MEAEIAPESDVRERRRVPRRLLLITVGTLVFVAAGGGAAYSLAPTRGATPTPAARAPAASPTVARTFGPTPTPVPLEKAETLARAGAPKAPMELQVPFVGGSWPLGVFVLESREGPSKKAGSKTVSIELGVLNEASQPLTIAAAGQYKEAVSLYSDGHWKGLFFVGFRTAGGQDILPTDGSGAFDVPPGVWGQMHLEVDIAQDEGTPQLRAGVQRDNMPALALTALTLKPQGQPWAAPGAAPTPVTITATPAAGAPAAKPSG